MDTISVTQIVTKYKPTLNNHFQYEKRTGMNCSVFTGNTNVLKKLWYCSDVGGVSVTTEE